MGNITNATSCHDERDREEDLAEIEELLEQIRAEVAAIEAKLDNPHTGLVEIKTEVAAIEAALASPHTGLVEIKTEVAAIEAALASPHNGLAEIKTEVAAIEAAVANPHTGLAEIKAEIVQILGLVGGGALVRTSGPVDSGNGAHSILVTVLNNTALPQTVTINVFNATPPGPKANVTGSPVTVILGLSGSTTQKFDISGVDVFEVQVTASSPTGILLFAAARTEAVTAPIPASHFLPENTILNEDFVPVA
jgi:archaellum component FlaC